MNADKREWDRRDSKEKSLMQRYQAGSPLSMTAKMAVFLGSDKKFPICGEAVSVWPIDEATRKDWKFHRSVGDGARFDRQCRA